MEEDDEILVVGSRGSPEPRIIVNMGGLLSDYPAGLGARSWLPDFIENILNLQTKIAVDDDTLDAHHRALAITAIEKVMSLPMFKTLFEQQKARGLDISVEGVSSPSSIGGNLGITLFPGSTIDDYENLFIKVATHVGGEQISDFKFVVAVMHEILHTLGAADIDYKLDNQPGWDEQIARAAFSDTIISATDNSIQTNSNDLIYSGPSGGIINGGGADAILIGSDFVDTINVGSGRSFIFSGGGNDVIRINNSAGIVDIRDDGGNDVIELVDIASVSQIEKRWDQDSQSIGLYADGRIFASIASESGVNSIENIRIGGLEYSTNSLNVAENSKPYAESQLFEIIGGHQGLIGTVHASDANDDDLIYSLSEISGAYSFDNWTVDKAGRIFANFNREDHAGSEFTTMKMSVSDKLSTSEFDVTVRWGSSTSPNPEFGNIHNYIPQMNEEIPFNSFDWW